MFLKKEQVQAYRLAAKSAAALVKGSRTLQDSTENRVEFKNASGSNLQHYKVMEDDHYKNLEKLVQAAVYMNEEKSKAMRDSIDDMDDSLEKSRKNVQLEGVKIFKKEFERLTAIDLGALKDSTEFPTIAELGFSYNSGTTFLDPNFYTPGLPSLQYLATYGKYVRGGIPFTTEIVKNQFVTYSGGYSNFNSEIGATRGSYLNQKVTHINSRVFRKAMRYSNPTFWSNMFREAHGIPYTAIAKAGYFLDKAKDRGLASGDPRSGIYGIINCDRTVIDVSAASALIGLTDGTFEGTALRNLFKALLVKIRTIPANGGGYTIEVPSIYIPQNTYTLLEEVDFRLIAKEDATSFVGSTDSHGTFLEWLSSRSYIGEVVSAPVTQPRITMLVKTSIQTYDPFVVYMSADITATTLTMQAAPAASSTEVAFTQSEVIVFNPENIVDLILPDAANLNVFKREYVAVGTNKTDIVKVNFASEVQTFPASIGNDTEE